jgi:hypothetical protein
MKYITTILLTFILAFATSMLFEIDFIKNNPVRYVLVTLIIAIELLAGLLIIKQISKEN